MSNRRESPRNRRAPPQLADDDRVEIGCDMAAVQHSGPRRRNPIFQRMIDAGHNNIWDRPAFAAAMQGAFARI
jgi:hypothetical protein